MIYSWQRETWHALTESFSHEKLPHALLFSGVEGTGKSAFVTELSRYILCEQRQKGESFCDLHSPCHSCRLVETNVHPNLYQVSPEKAGAVIKIDQIRELIEFATQTAYMGKHQCIIINPAQQMNIFSANSLLKTLEEPSPNVFLFLITPERSRLPSTIVSRVMHVEMRVPEQTVALDWLLAQSKKPSDEMILALKIATGAPLKALSLLQSDGWKARELIYQTLQMLQQKPNSLMQCALTLQDIEMPVLIDFLLSWTIDLAKLKCGVEVTYIENQDYQETLIAFSTLSTLSSLDLAMHHLMKIRQDISLGTHLNKTLTIENLLMLIMRSHHVFS